MMILELVLPGRDMRKALLDGEKYVFRSHVVWESTEIVEPPFRQALIPAMETSGQRPQNSTSAGLPRFYPPLRVSTDGKVQK